MIHHGDLFDVLPTLEPDSIDASVTDGPYGIGFMGREWDTFKPDRVANNTRKAFRQYHGTSTNPNVRGRRRSPAMSPSQIEYDYSVNGLRAFQAFTEAWGREVLRVLKPGAYILSCGAPRSHHRMMCGLEDAGFVVRDCFAWLFGSGFPKNYNLGDGKGTALKPAHEPIALAWKPFKGTIRACHETHGTAALNIDSCRIDFAGPQDAAAAAAAAMRASADQNAGRNTYGDFNNGPASIAPYLAKIDEGFGRWPANVLLDEDAAAMLNEQSGHLTSGQPSGMKNGVQGNVFGHFAGGIPVTGFGDSGGASRFYYTAKPSREERDMGCYDLELRQRDESRKEGNPGGDNPRNRGLQSRGNFHPTVKPVELMRWLVRLVTPLNGLVLDPFAGSGTTGMACVYEHRRFIGIEREADYVAIAERRIREVAPLFWEHAK